MLLEDGDVEVVGELVLLEVVDGVLVEEELVLLGEGEAAGDLAGVGVSPASCLTWSLY